LTWDGGSYSAAFYNSTMHFPARPCRYCPPGIAPPPVYVYPAAGLPLRAPGRLSVSDSLPSPRHRCLGLTLTRGVCLLPWGSRGVAAVLAVCCVCCGPCRLLCRGGGVPCGGKHIIISRLTLSSTWALIRLGLSTQRSPWVLCRLRRTPHPALVPLSLCPTPWPLQDIVITNIVWCMAYTREVGGGGMLPNSCAIVLHHGGQCRRARGMTGWLNRALTPPSERISCNGQPTPPPPPSVSPHASSHEHRSTHAARIH